MIQTSMDKLKAAFAALLLSAPAVHAGCAGSDAACDIDGGTYHIELPENPDGAPALMFIHGFGSSGAGMLKMRGMVNAFKDAGYAVIAPDGTKRQGRNGRSWSFHPLRPQQRDEVSFLTAVRDDAVDRFGLDVDAMVMGGFSIGGSMTSYLACAAPDTFTAYLPVAGGFWRPHPTTCAGPVRVLHTHGWTDTTVPLEGRVLRGQDMDDPKALMQGDIFTTMEIWRDANGCKQLRGDRFQTKGTFWRRAWDRCDEGTALELALFPGGHAVPRGWAAMALDWLEKLPSGS
jgi:polyhydroxybutyrate depolymerase